MKAPSSYGTVTGKKLTKSQEPCKMKPFNKLALFAGVAELADAQDLGSCGRKAVGVQIPPSAPCLLGIRGKARIPAFCAAFVRLGLDRKAQTLATVPRSPRLHGISRGTTRTVSTTAGG